MLMKDSCYKFCVVAMLSSFFFLCYKGLVNIFCLDKEILGVAITRMRKSCDKVVECTANQAI